MKWDEKFAFTENRFTLENLKDLRYLLSKYRDRCTAQIARFSTYCEGLKTPTNPPSADAKYALAVVRGYWLKNFHEDIFVSYGKDPQKVAEILIANYEGDIAQLNIALDSVGKLIDYLEKGFAPDAGPADSIVEIVETPDMPRKPFLLLEIMVHNLGKSETLILGDAWLAIGDERFRLTGLVERLGVEVHSGKYFRVKPNAVEELTFTQHPDHTTKAQLAALNQILNQRADVGQIELQDFAGKKYSIKGLKLSKFET